MRRLVSFIQITLDGYFADPNGDVSWAHKDDPEFKGFVEENASGEGALVLGRVTYDMMAKYWPTSLAKQNDPVVAEGMNRMPKIVFSRTLKDPAWSNTKVISGDVAGEMRRLKEESGPHMAILGSGSIVRQLTDAGLIDEYQVVVVPVALGKGKTLFEGIEQKLTLNRTKTRNFQNGNVFLSYEPAK
jgi:dihydrofolate reductase